MSSVVNKDKGSVGLKELGDSEGVVFPFHPLAKKVH